MVLINRSFIRQVGLFKWMIRYGTLQFRKRVLKRDSRLRLPTGITMVLTRYSGNASEIYVTNANTDWGAEAIFARFSDPTRDFLDIGSHIGYYALYLAPLVRRAYAFEPCPRNLPYLRDNARRAANVEVVEMAVSSFDSEADFFQDEALLWAALRMWEETSCELWSLPLTVSSQLTARLNQASSKRISRGTTLAPCKEWEQRCKSSNRSYCRKLRCQRN